jgi:Reverse transcriptase (RNA-dependent DNA polymerase)
MPLPLLWVFKYKLDTDGFLTKFKARLCVRGDMQVTEKDTYAATLAARTFRALMAIAAAFDLEMEQYDAVNVFINSELDEEVLCLPPEGFGRPGFCWCLLRALYGLKQSPLLWYNHLSAALESLGLLPVPGVNCLFANRQLLVFFYVDDIVVLYHRRATNQFRAFKSVFMSKFELRALGELQWFLGIRIERDRAAQKIWLCQDSYIDKIASRFNVKFNRRSSAAPLPVDALGGVLEEDRPQATQEQILAFQQRVGSLNFAAVISRPDIAHAASKLARYLKNPTAEALSLSNRVIAYLYATRTLAIEYCGASNAQIFECSSDAAFGDCPSTRRSSDGFLFKLYGGPIDWRASKQKTVTTSSTEAELLALSSAAREMLWWHRFFAAVRFDTEQDVNIDCDNQQTIRLVTGHAARLDTRLRHVDIHRHWLRQEQQAGRICVNWVPTAEMPADGLTKALPGQRHQIFVKQLNLVDISHQIDAQKSKQTAAPAPNIIS